MKQLNEVWKDIEGYEGLYQVSNLGNIRSLNRLVTYSDGRKNIHKGKKIMKSLNVQGYEEVTLSSNGIRKTFRVNRLVAKAFIPNPNNLPEVNHKDEIKTNNIVDNLEWCTSKYNCNYGTRGKRISSKIDYKNIAEINKIKNSKKVFQYTKELKLIKIWESLSSCNKKYSINSISRCCNNHIKTYKGYIWRYSRLEGGKQ